jgi:hypothetical protein
MVVNDNYISGSYAFREKDQSIVLSPFMTHLNLYSLKVTAFYWSQNEELASSAYSSYFPQINLNTSHTRTCEFFNVLNKCRIGIVCGGPLGCVPCGLVGNILKEHTAPIFRAEVCANNISTSDHRSSSPEDRGSVFLKMLVYTKFTWHRNPEDNR